MEEKISAVFAELCKGKNLINLSETTIKNYAAAISEDVTSEDQITDAFKVKHEKVLTTMNGQLYRDNTDAINKFKSEYKPPIDPKTPPVVPPVTPPETDPKVLAMEKTIARMERERAAEIAARAQVALVDGIKSLYTEEATKAKFAAYVDIARVDSKLDAQANYETLSKSFEAMERLSVDRSTIRKPSGAPSGFDKNKYDDVFPTKKE